MERFRYIAVLAALVVVQGAFAFSGRVPIRNFASVTDNLYRGARPGDAGVAALSQMGVKTIVNLEDNDQAVREEMQTAKGYGIRVISVPLDTQSYPSDSDIDRALAGMKQTSGGPVFVHCMHGEDRTGLLVGLYRVETQHWTAKQAWDEMLQMNFHPRYRQLVKYFEDATGFRAP